MAGALELREPHRDDLEQIATLYGHYVEHSFATFDTEVPSVGEWERKLADARAKGQPWRVAATPDGLIAGYASCGTWMARPAYRSTVTTAVYLRDGQTGAGIGRRLYGSLLAAAAQAGFHRAVAGVALPNPASVALHERFGYRLVGTFEQVGHKLGAWRDVAWFERRLVGGGEQDD